MDSNSQSNPKTSSYLNPTKDNSEHSKINDSEKIEEENNPKEGKVKNSSHLNQDIGNSQVQGPDWTSFILKRSVRAKPLATMLFDTYIVMVVDDFLVKMPKQNDYEDSDDEERATYELRDGDDVTLLAVDLRDYSVQEVQIHDRSFFFDEKRNGAPNYTLTKYGDNQIIKYGMVKRNLPILSLITIESFYRILFSLLI